MSDLDEQNDNQVYYLAPMEFSVERVYPIRSQVNSDRYAVASSKNEDNEGSRQPTAPTKFESKDALRAPSPPNSHSTGTDDSNESQSRKISERFKLLPSKSGAPSVWGKHAEDDKPIYRRCEDEPIHIPGAIQSYGALVGLKYSSSGQLEVRIVSENTRKILGYGPEQLFALRSFLDILNPDVRDEMAARVSHALSSAEDMENETRLDVFQMSITFPYEPETRLWCAIHLASTPKGLVICEFEDYSDAFYLKDGSATKILPVNLVRSTGLDVSPEEFKRSTTSFSKPLPVIEIARQRKQKEFSSLDIFNAMSQSQRQLSKAPDLQSVFDVVVGIISELTGFHRVMFYRFDNQKNGSIEAELLNPNASSDIYRGLHYPASDIPKQARDLYKINRIRILHDRDAETARLVARNESDFKQPLDLTHSYLRAISPVHIKYLINMGVRSSLSISIVIKDDLWGLIACHGYGDIGTRVSLPIRELCRNIGECAALNIERLLMFQRIEARKPPVAPPVAQHPATFIAASSTDLLKVFDADFGLINIQDEARAIGRLDPYQEALAMLAYLQTRGFTTVQASQSITTDYSDIKYAPGIHTISGLLFIPLGSGGVDFIVFFRKGQVKEVKWAGNPHNKSYKAGSEYLEPRTSFKRWVEKISGMSKEWTEDQRESASVLGLLYGRFIEIWRQKETASQQSRLTQLLIKNSSQEVRTPLNAIINYLEMALDNKVDELTCEILKRAQKSSRSLIYAIDDLLKLTKAEQGQVFLIDDTFNLSSTVQDVAAAFRKEANRKCLELTVTTHEGIPEMVKGDSARLRQVLTNLTKNAFEHSVDSGVKLDIRPISNKENRCVVSISVQDAGLGMSETQLDDLFQSFEQVLDEDSEPNIRGQESPTPEKNGSVSSLGLGLAVVARYVRNMNGQIRVMSELGKGTIFAIEIPFEHATSPTTQSPGKSPPSVEHAGGSVVEKPSESRALSPSNMPPFMKNMQPTSKQILKVIETRTRIEGAFSPLTDMQTFGQQEASDCDQAASIYSSGSEAVSQWPDMDIEGQSSLVHLRILIAEDNPINLRLLNRKLVRRGHDVELCCDGQECHDYYVSNPDGVDIILMDLQMPLVDGPLATRMIRYHEKGDNRKDIGPPEPTQRRVCIIAVSASLYEESRYDYIQSGFDGWLLKPIDFRRLDLLLQCVKIPELRREAVYKPGSWEQGGLFLP
ncbi:hypothetical protein BP6252_00175 [Coleophoma cylindrospora]|uniref:Uncharacterized protein n=1 Tax=Coleophoma cylindrospora TaxID=1849047 RepID=A0A3D8SP88_9HELO|nr:hypothetical protein BP6252_00175 [Coleophoma cylindrospora]